MLLAGTSTRGFAGSLRCSSQLDGFVEPFLCYIASRVYCVATSHCYLLYVFVNCYIMLWYISVYIVYVEGSRDSSGRTSHQPAEGH